MRDAMRDPAPERRGVELVIFDCDGVLVDSDRIALQIQARVDCLTGRDRRRLLVEVAVAAFR